MKRTLAAVLAFFLFAAPAGAAGRNIRIYVQTDLSSYRTEGASQTTSTTSQGQMLVVSDGMEGRFFVGERVPLVTYFYNYLMGEGYLTGIVSFQEVGTSMLVRAREVDGGQIEVTLTPEVSYISDRGHGVVALQKLSSTVIVPSGASLEIGGSTQQSEFNSNFFRTASGQSVRVVLTPAFLD